MSAWSIPDSFIITAVESQDATPQSVVQLASLVAATTTWQPEDVTVSQIPARVISESGKAVDVARRQSAVAGHVELPLQSIAPEESVPRLEELQSGDHLMAAWDDVIWNEESAPTKTPEHQNSSPAQKSTAIASWVTALAHSRPQCSGIAEKTGSRDSANDQMVKRSSGLRGEIPQNGIQHSKSDCGLDEHHRGRLENPDGISKRVLQ